MDYNQENRSEMYFIDSIREDLMKEFCDEEDFSQFYYDIFDAYIVSIADASDEEVLMIAKLAGIDLEKYLKN